MARVGTCGASTERSVGESSFACFARDVSYTFDKTLETSFDDAVAKTRDALGDAGFGVLTEIDVAATMKKKLDEEMPSYLILGACHPPSAWKALQAETKIGTMLPCNVIVRDLGEGRVEVSAVDPVASMQAIHSTDLAEVASDVRKRLSDVIQAL